MSDYSSSSDDEGAASNVPPVEDSSSSDDDGENNDNGDEPVQCPAWLPAAMDYFYLLHPGDPMFAQMDQEYNGVGGEESGDETTGEEDSDG